MLSCVLIFYLHDSCCGKYRRSSIENDYCGGKPGLSLLPLILTLTLTWTPILRTLLTLTLTLTILTLLTLIDQPQTLVYRRNSHFRCYCGGIYRRKRFIHFIYRFNFNDKVAYWDHCYFWSTLMIFQMLCLTWSSYSQMTQSCLPGFVVSVTVRNYRLTCLHYSRGPKTGYCSLIYPSARF